MKKFQDYEAECETFIDSLFPYLLIASFILGLLIMRLKNIFTFGESKLEEKNSFDSSSLKFDENKKEKKF
jgi:hypothetical protein